MQLPAEGARWLISPRWCACAGVFVVIFLASSVAGVVPNPLPLYAVALGMVGYNVLFNAYQKRHHASNGSVDRSIFAQVFLDLIALTLLLYFSDLPRNPFLVYFVFHMIIAGMYLRGWSPYFLP